MPWTAIGTVVGILSFVLAFFCYFNNSIEQKIDNKLKDSNFIQKIAKEIRLPFVIFDDNESISVDTGAFKYIEKIEVKKERQDISEIIVSLKNHMAVPPILESLDTKIHFEEPTRGKKNDFIYKTVKIATAFVSTYASGKQPKQRFRLQFVIFPE